MKKIIIVFALAFFACTPFEPVGPVTIRLEKTQHELLVELMEYNTDMAELDTTVPTVERDSAGNILGLTIGARHLDSIPPAIYRMTHLQTLELTGNQITVIKPEIANLKKLTALNMTRNYLQSLPPEIMQLKNLVHVSFEQNYLCMVPDSIEAWLRSANAKGGMPEFGIGPQACGL